MEEEEEEGKGFRSSKVPGFEVSVSLSISGLVTKRLWFFGGKIGIQMQRVCVFVVGVDGWTDGLVVSCVAWCRPLSLCLSLSTYLSLLLSSVVRCGAAVTV